MLSLNRLTLPMVLFTLLSVPEKSYPVGSCMAQRGGGGVGAKRGV